ncbi:PfkB family carbohydrate kinase [Micromonospora sp. NPDC052213]|uniref:sugar kinase n=1 Tax=Micromonospora sp. NPDC052213 TaxID=3155812 RepID=UPI003421517E
MGLARLGYRVASVGRVGDDPFGASVRRVLRGEGVDVAAARIDRDRPTGLLVRDCLAERPITVHYARAGSAGSALESGDLPADWTGVRMLHVSGITPMLSRSARAATHAAVDAARSAGALISVDPNVRLRLGDRNAWREALMPLVAGADPVTTGRDEAALRGGGDDPVAWLHAQGARWVTVKDGVRGAVGSDGGTVVYQPAIPGAAVDPVGAGDAFTAGWLSAVRRGLPLRAALAEAAAVAAARVQVAGDAVEVSLTTPGALDAIAELADEVPSGAVLGAGTLLDARRPAPRSARVPVSWSAPPWTSRCCGPACAPGRR